MIRKYWNKIQHWNKIQIPMISGSTTALNNNTKTNKSVSPKESMHVLYIIWRPQTDFLDHIHILAIFHWQGGNLKK